MAKEEFARSKSHVRVGSEKQGDLQNILSVPDSDFTSRMLKICESFRTAFETSFTEAILRAEKYFLTSISSIKCLEHSEIDLRYSMLSKLVDATLKTLYETLGALMSNIQNTYYNGCFEVSSFIANYESKVQQIISGFCAEAKKLVDL